MGVKKQDYCISLVNTCTYLTISFPAMPNSHDINGLQIIINRINNPVVASTNPPQIAATAYFATTIRSGIRGK
jgi:hypothetical protein